MRAVVRADRPTRTRSLFSPKEKDAGHVPEEYDQVDRHMRKARGIAHQEWEQREVRVHEKELVTKRVERGIGSLLDRRHPDWSA